ncbi:hypothetical protein L1049_016069 [Liquidambar formosana]|uniref:Uncharacterized protein n=1 Tax=Liquidambar formosana TaxID=63359 RepID=A0AAP0X2E0_LIQFO
MQTGSSFQHTNSQQQKPNPFGFGVQNSSQSKGATDYGSKQNQFKSFENKWSRFSPITTGSNASSRQPDNQPQAASHQCTDPESCKRQIVEDFEQERPLWKLTSYSHCKNAPCDIVGDITYEELRAAAYDDAKRGLNLPSIVERERSLLNAKLIEFENLLRNPYAVPPNSTLATRNPPPNQNASSLSAQNSGPPSVSSFSQLGASLNMGFGMRPSAPSTSAFGQSNAFQISSQTSNVFGTNNLPFGSAGSFGSQLPAQTLGTPFALNSTNFGNSEIRNNSNAFIPSAASPQIPSSASNQSTLLSNVSNSAFNGVGQATMNLNLVDNMQRENVSRDASIWLKEKWNPGEIPEEAPPAEFV